MMSEKAGVLCSKAFLSVLSITIALALAVSFPVPAFAATASDKQAEAQAALSKLDAVNAKLQKAEADYEAAAYEHAQAQAAMDEAQGKIDDASARISDLQEQLGTRARGMYRSGSASFLDLLLGSTTFQSFANNWGILNDLNETDAEMVQETKVLRAEVEEQKAVYAEEEKQAAEKANEAERVKNESASLQADMQATYNSLSAEAAALVEQEQAARNQAAEAAAPAQANNTNSGNKDSGGNKNNGGSSNSSNNNIPNISGGAVGRAYGCIDTPYVLGAGGPEAFDCSGFVSYCLTGRYGRVLGWTGTMSAYPTVTNPQAGDICYWDGHVGLYIGGGQMIHASASKGKVVQTAVSWSESALGPCTYKRYR